jgi:hypothetical protein
MFILSYVGAFHAPAPSEISIAVVAPEEVSNQLVPQLNSLDRTPQAGNRGGRRGERAPTDPGRHHLRRTDRRFGGQHGQVAGGQRGRHLGVRRGPGAMVTAPVAPTRPSDLPYGAGTETIRRIVYFGGLGIGIQLAVTVGWAVIGAGVAIPASRFHYHRALAIEYPTAGRGGKQPESEEPDPARA